MTPDQNKAVVCRFITEVLVGGDVDVADEVLAPNYTSRAIGADREAFKAFIANSPAFSDRRFDSHDLVADGDAVVARFSFEITDPTGRKVSARGLSFYRLADGKIVEDDAITTPDLTQAFGDIVPSAGL
jgi:ketosteroid isomerase-like protein